MAVSKRRFGLGVLLAAALASATGKSKAQPTADKQQPARTDLYGDPLPEGAIGRLGTLRFRHPSWVSDLAFQAEGKQLVSACWDRSVHVWDVSTGREVRCCPPPADVLPREAKAAVLALVLSADGKTVLGADDQHTVHLWDAARGKEMHCLRGRNGFALALSPDGKTLAVGQGGGEPGQQVALWDLATGKRLREQGAAARQVHALAFSSDGKVLAAGDGFDKNGNDVEDAQVRMWDPATGRQLREMGGHTGGISAVVFAPDGRRLASCSHDSTIRLWDLDTGRQVRILRVRDDTIALEGPQHRQETAHGGVLTVAFSPDGKLLASGSADGTVRFWDPENGEELHILRGHGAAVTKVVFSRDGKMLASASRDHTIRLWDPVGGKPLQGRPGQDGPIHNLAVSRDGRLVAALGKDRRIRLWSAHSAKQHHLLARHKQLITSAAFAPDGQTLASADLEGNVRLWDIATGKEVPFGWEPLGPVYCVAFASGPNLLLAAGRSGTLDVWDVGAAKSVRQISANGPIRHMQTSRDGKLVAASDQLGVHVWDVATGKERLRAPGDNPSLALSADGRLLATSSSGDATIRLRNAATGEPIGSLPYQADEEDYPGVAPFVLSPDGRLLAGAGRDSSIQLWETASGKVRRQLHGHVAEVGPLVFSPDGRLLYSGSDDTTVLIWDVARRHEARPARLTETQLQGLWSDLAGDDAERADRAIGTLARLSEQGLPFLAERLRPARPADPQLLARLIADLDHDEFAVRQKATHDLEQLHEMARPALRQALKQSPSVEARRRMERLLRRPRGPLQAGEPLRLLRAGEVLERIGTPEAQRLLRRLTEGAAEAWPTLEAKVALERLGSRAGGKR